jgi:hypothetical protein
MVSESRSRTSEAFMTELPPRRTNAISRDPTWCASLSHPTASDQRV